MAQRRNRFCRQCGHEPPDGMRCSQNGLCPPCGVANQAAAQRAMATGRGAIAKRWREGTQEARALAALIAAGYDADDLDIDLCPGCASRPQTRSGLCLVCLADRAGISVG